MKSSATCTAKAVYYYCCSRCTSKGSTTYEYGSANGHTSVNGGTQSVHKKCSVCGVTLEDGSKHSYTVDSGEVICYATCCSYQWNYLMCACGYNPRNTDIAYQAKVPDTNNHVGGTYIYGQTSTYTGYELCSGCNAIIKYGCTYSAPTAKTLTYNTSAQVLINAGSANPGTMYYSLDGSNWSATLPVGTNATVYTVYYYCDGGSNYTSSPVGSLTVEIKDNAYYVNEILYAPSGGLVTYEDAWAAKDKDSSAITKTYSAGTKLYIKMFYDRNKHDQGDAAYTKDNSVGFTMDDNSHVAVYVCKYGSEWGGWCNIADLPKKE